MRIVIDARLYGLENAGLGRYTINLIDRLQKIDTRNEYFILLRKKYYDSLIMEGNFQKVLCEIAHYSLKEQLGLSGMIEKLNPDLTHFLHFNVPLNFRRKFIVTIHDMTMHWQKTNSSSLFFPIYFAKHFGYKKVFRHAVTNACKIIVPSMFVKSELVKNLEIVEKKVEVIYEGA